MGILADAFRVGGSSANAAADPIDPAELEPGVGSMLLSPFSAILDALDYSSATTRAGLGSLLGVEGTGRETPFGSAPSGRELLGLGAGTPGEFESGDVPGFVVELAADPLNLLGVGAATKAGKLAKTASDASRRAEALANVGRRLEAAQYLRAARSAAKELKTTGKAADYGKTLGQQAARGQRSLLSLDIPFTDINVPISLTGGRLSQAALGGLGRAGRLAAKPFAPLEPLFRRIGRAGAVDVADETARGAFNDIVEVADDRAREGLRMGREEKGGIDRFLNTRDRKIDQTALADIQARVRPLAEQAADNAPTLQRLLKRAASASDPAKAAALTAKADALRERLLTKFAVAISPDADPSSALLLLGMEKAAVPGKLGDLSTRVAQNYSRKIGEWQQKYAVAMSMGNTADLPKIQGTITRLRNNLAAKVADISRRTAVADEIVNNLPAEVLTEANRIRTVLDGRLAVEQGEGVIVSALADPELGYAHRMLTTEGAKLAEQMAAIDGSPFVKYARTFNPEKGFTKQRVKAFDGMTITQINDWARREAARRGIKFEGQFFAEDPGEIALRRLMDGGRSIESANVMRGTVERFAVPGGKGMDVADFLKQAKLGRLGSIDTVGSVGDIKAALAGTRFENAVIPEPLARAALNTFKVFDTPDELKKIGGVFSKYNAMMRFWLTIPFPAYHFRNAASNVFMNWMAGMDNPKYYFRAAMLQREARAALVDPAKASAKQSASLALLRKIEDLGAANSSQLTETLDLTQLQTGQRRGKIAQAFIQPGEQTPIVGKAAKAGQWIENNAKVALFLDGKARGMTDAAAAERVKKFLFNYSDLSSFEKNHVRQWSFFYTFQRKNIPLMIEQLFTNPRRMRAAGFTFGYGQNDSDEFMTEYQKSKAMLDLNATDDDGNRLFFQAGLPIEGLTQYEGERKPPLAALSTIARKVLSNVVPPVAVPIQAATGVNLRSGQPTTLPETLLGATPLSRVLSTIQRARQENAPVSDAILAPLVGAPTRINPQAGRERALLERLRNRKMELVQQGRGRVRQDAFATDETAREEFRALNSLEQRIQQRLRERGVRQ